MTEVLNETDYEIDIAEFVQLADFVLSAMHVSTEVELNIIFIDPEPMEELHVRWLDLEGPTDVMSFPMDELRPGTAEHPTASGTLGDICIFLATHGMLHLMGYDHAEPEEKEEMFALQRQLLLSFLAQR